MNIMSNNIVVPLTSEYRAKAIEHRRKLHVIPELDQDLPKTTAYIRGILEENRIPYEVTSNTGIVARLNSGTEGKCIALRADMDALPIKEETGLSFASINGNMHACGHDAHMSILLTTLEILNQHKDLWNGTVVGIFQPAEETTGGAQLMIEEGALNDVDVVFGLHIGSLFPEVEGGKIGLKAGSLMSSVDKLSLTIKGKGGHGANPQDCVDPVLSMASVIVSLQQIVSRNINPLNSAVISVGAAHAGEVANIIPDEAKILATIRVLRHEDRSFIKDRIIKIIEGVTSAHNTESKITYEEFYPPTMNDPWLHDFVSNEAIKLFGKEQVVNLEKPTMGTEDFSYYALERPAYYFMLGSRNAIDGRYYPHHNSRFDVDEKDLEKGVAMFLSFAMDFDKYGNDEKT